MVINYYLVDFKVMSNHEVIKEGDSRNYPRAVIRKRLSVYVFSKPYFNTCFK